jgi:hypothetical protein
MKYRFQSFYQGPAGIALQGLLGCPADFFKGIRQ